jgi:hypothetical protein
MEAKHRPFLAAFLVAATIHPAAAAEADPPCPTDQTSLAKARGDWTKADDVRKQALDGLEKAQAAVAHAVEAARAAHPGANAAALEKLERKVARGMDAPEALPADVPEPMKKAVAGYLEARQEFEKADKRRLLAEACFPGHVNTLVFVGSLARIASAEAPPATDAAHPASYEVDGQRCVPGAGAWDRPACPAASFFDAVWDECRRGEDIRDLGASQGVWNVTRIEGTTPHVWSRPAPPAQPAGASAGRPEPPSAPSYSLLPMPLKPDSAIAIMSAVYDPAPVEEGALLPAGKRKLQCRTLQFLHTSQVASVEVTTYGISGTARNRIDLLSADQAQGIRDRLASQYYLVIPVRDFMRFSTAQVSEDVLQDGQLVDLSVTRVMTALERDRLGTKATESQTVRTSWALAASSMPAMTIRLPALVGIAQSSHPKFGEEPAFVVGSGLALSYRWSLLRSWPGKFLALEASLQGARRVGSSPKRADQSDAVPDTLWGVGATVNLSGYLGIGASYLGDFRFTRPQWFFTLEPAPWLSKAIGLEKRIGTGGN